MGASLAVRDVVTRAFGSQEPGHSFSDSRATTAAGAADTSSGTYPQPRQRAQLHRRAQHVVPPAELPGEHLISRREREVPDQLSTGRLGKPPQLRQLIF